MFSQNHEIRVIILVVNILTAVIIGLIIIWFIKKANETDWGNQNNTEKLKTEKGYLSRGFEEVEEAEKEPAKYSDNYEKRGMIMSLREKIFFDKLKQVVVGDFDIYPQVHVDKILQPRRGLFGNNRLWAFRGISQKSVDFLIVDNNQSPVLAIELDDSTHEKEDRAERDWFIECAFKNVGVPLLRFAARTNYDVSDLDSIRRFLTNQI